jgi:hypothetical protein
MTKNGEILFDPGIPGEFISPKAFLVLFAPSKST